MPSRARSSTSSSKASSAGRVGVRHRLGVEDEPRRRRRRGADRLAHAALEVAGVGEEQPVVEAVDDDRRASPRATDAPRRRRSGRAARPSRARRRARARCGGRCRSSRGRPRRPAPRARRSTTTQPIVTPAIATSTRSTAASARQAGTSISPIAAKTITAPSTAFGRYCTGSVRKSEDQRDRGGGDQPGDLAARAHRVVDRGARAAGADREALREAGRRVGGAHRQQLLRGAHLLVVLPGERARGEDLVGERDEEDAERGRHEARRRPPSAGRRQVDARQARRDLARRPRRRARRGRAPTRAPSTRRRRSAPPAASARSASARTASRARSTDDRDGRRR